MNTREVVYLQLELHEMLYFDNSLILQLVVWCVVVTREVSGFITLFVNIVDSAWRCGRSSA